MRGNCPNYDFCDLSDFYDFLKKISIKFNFPSGIFNFPSSRNKKASARNEKASARNKKASTRKEKVDKKGTFF